MNGFLDNRQQKSDNFSWIYAIIDTFMIFYVKL